MRKLKNLIFYEFSVFDKSSFFLRNQFKGLRYLLYFFTISFPSKTALTTNETSAITTNTTNSTALVPEAKLKTGRSSAREYITKLSTKNKYPAYSLLFGGVFSVIF